MGLQVIGHNQSIWSIQKYSFFWIYVLIQTVWGMFHQNRAILDSDSGQVCIGTFMYLMNGISDEGGVFSIFCGRLPSNNAELILIGQKPGVWLIGNGHLPISCLLSLHTHSGNQSISFYKSLTIGLLIWMQRWIHVWPQQKWVKGHWPFG